VRVADNFYERWNHTKKSNDAKLTFLPSTCGRLQLPNDLELLDYSKVVRTYRKETSAKDAYIEIIKQAEKLLYIENQYFYGKKNQVIEALKHRLKQVPTLKVIVVLPMVMDNDLFLATLMHKYLKA
jgi:hypothetical protein